MAALPLCPAFTLMIAAAMAGKLLAKHKSRQRQQTPQAVIIVFTSKQWSMRFRDLLKEAT